MEALGEFDLDPCAPVEEIRAWNTAKRHFSIKDDGLAREWFGRVFCNPPYGNETRKWLKKMADHNNGIALIYARTETRMFFDYIWDKAEGIFFIKSRIKFYQIREDGKPVIVAGAGAPSCLVAYGPECAETLLNCTLPGKYLAIPKATTHLTDTKDV